MSSTGFFFFFREKKSQIARLFLCYRGLIRRRTTTTYSNWAKEFVTRGVLMLLRPVSWFFFHKFALKKIIKPPPPPPSDPKFTYIYTHTLCVNIYTRPQKLFSLRRKKYRETQPFHHCHHQTGSFSLSFLYTSVVHICRKVCFFLFFWNEMASLLMSCGITVNSHGL